MFLQILLRDEVRLKDLTLDCVQIYPYMGSIVTIKSKMKWYIFENMFRTSFTVKKKHN